MHHKKPFVVTCIPAFNEEMSIARVALLARRHVDKVVVCVAGSGDLAWEVHRKLVWFDRGVRG